MEEKQWIGWKDISIEQILIGDTVTKGKDIWQKNYTYICIPTGYGYDGYCFLLSSKCVGETYFSICNDMHIELFKHPEQREPGKKYPRYKMDGYELFEKIFRDYEINFEAEYLKRLKKEEQDKEHREKSIKGKCICGIYTGNIYGNSYNGYIYDAKCRAFFASDEGCTYQNKKFQKVKNVNCHFVVCDMTKYEFSKWEDIINAYLEEYDFYYYQAEALRKHIEKSKNKSKIEMKYHPECLVRTDIEDLHTDMLVKLEEIMQKIRERLKNRIEMLKKSM